jgi:hypothetical protein
MANKTDIKEGAKFRLNGRTGRAYAVTEKKIDQGLVDLIFEGPGNLSDAPPSGLFRIECLELIN